MIVKCKECGHNVSTEATVCPSCGCPQHSIPKTVEVSTTTENRKSHMNGWIALIAFLMSNFIPAILVPLVVLVAFVFAFLEIRQGSKIFGGIMIALCAFQAWFVADHFGGLSGSLGLTNPKQIEETTAKKYATTNLNVPSDASLDYS